MLAKIIGDELGNREGWSILSKMTTLLYYLFIFCKVVRNELGNREGWSFFVKNDHPSLLPNSFPTTFSKTYSTT